MSAAFASRSSRFGRETAMSGPLPGTYNLDEHDSMAASARARATPRSGAFGGSSSRSLPWQKQPEDVPRGAMRGSSTPRSEELASVRSTFGASKGPSAAFSGGSDRFATSRPATPGPGAYAGERVPLSPSKRINRSSSFNSKSKRFVSVIKDDGPGPGQFDAKPSAFAPPTHRGAQTNPSAAFGSRSARASPFEKKDENAPGPEYTLPGAFASRNDSSKANGGAAFASRSGRFAKTYDQGAQGADPGAYSSDFHSMARSASKSFNKQSANGVGGFGTSQRRPEQIPGGRGAHTESPGPAAYESQTKTGAFATAAAKDGKRPSAAFASKSRKDDYVRSTDGPGVAVYHADEHDSLAGNANKSFNRKHGSASFGTRAQREMTRGTTSTPGPGAYDKSDADPNRPSFEAQQSSRRKSGGWGASSTPRAVDPSSWQRAAL